MREDDPHWQATCSRVIEFFSATWGGGYNIIVPLGNDGKDINNPFWDILDIYDPDYLFLYYYSGEDIKRNEPENYEQWLNKHVQQFISGGPVSSVDSARKQIDKQLRNSPRFEQPHAELQQKTNQNAGTFPCRRTRV